jgi:hypothetical protein
MHRRTTDYNPQQPIKGPKKGINAVRISEMRAQVGSSAGPRLLNTSDGRLQAAEAANQYHPIGDGGPAEGNYQPRSSTSKKGRGI